MASEAGRPDQLWWTPTTFTRSVGVGAGHRARPRVGRTRRSPRPWRRMLSCMASAWRVSRAWTGLSGSNGTSRPACTSWSTSAENAGLAQRRPGPVAWPGGRRTGPGCPGCTWTGRRPPRWRPVGRPPRPGGRRIRTRRARSAGARAQSARPRHSRVGRSVGRSGSATAQGRVASRAPAGRAPPDPRSVNAVRNASVSSSVAGHRLATRRGQRLDQPQLRADRAGSPGRRRSGAAPRLGALMATASDPEGRRLSAANVVDCMAFHAADRSFRLHLSWPGDGRHPCPRRCRSSWMDPAGKPSAVPQLSRGSTIERDPGPKLASGAHRSCQSS